MPGVQHQLQLQEETETILGTAALAFTAHGEVSHVFSHLKHVYHVFSARVATATPLEGTDLW